MWPVVQIALQEFCYTRFLLLGTRICGVSNKMKRIARIMNIVSNFKCHSDKNHFEYCQSRRKPDSATSLMICYFLTLSKKRKRTGLRSISVW